MKWLAICFTLCSCSLINVNDFEARIDRDGDGAVDIVFGGDDCDDGDAAISPAAEEIWYDGVDQNCDGASDYDQDGDGHDAIADGGSDCDDENPSAHPDALEVCDDEHTDEDCNGFSDEADPAMTEPRWFGDVDGDGFGDSSLSVVACEQPEGFVADDSDCRPDDPSAYPGAVDAWYDGIDSNCDGASDYDQDGDGSDRTEDGGSDCNDLDAAINVSAAEVCDPDNVDEDCNGVADDADSGVTGVMDWYIDADGDGFGDSSNPASSCDATALSVTGTDCDDDNATVYPGAPEACDGVTNGCSATIVERSVPGQYATIQQAVDSSRDGDAICVAPGTYLERVDLAAKSLTVIGTAGSASTVIDGESGGSVFRRNIVDGAIHLEGFTIQHAQGSDEAAVWISCETTACDVFADLSVTLRDLVVQDNLSRGVVVSGNGLDLVIEDTTIQRSQDSIGSLGGAGMLVASVSGTTRASLRRTLFRQNYSHGSGGGLAAHSVALTLDEVEFDENDTPEVGGGLALAGGSLVATTVAFSDNTGGGGGGGLHANNSRIAVEGALFLGNSGIGGWAAMEFLDGCAGESINLRGVDMVGNSDGFAAVKIDECPSVTLVDWSSVLDGRGIEVGSAGVLQISHMLVSGSSSNGLSITDAHIDSRIQVSHSSFVGNDQVGLDITADAGGTTVQVDHVIAAHNGTYGISLVSEPTPTLRFNDAYGNVVSGYRSTPDPTGTLGNRALDPIFVSYSGSVSPELWDLHLHSTSPLIDAGDITCSDFDGSQCDIGVYGGTSSF